MKKTVLFLCLVLSFLPTFGQNIESQPIASQYGTWRLPLASDGDYNFNPASCQLSAGNTNFAAFSQGTPVKIVQPDMPSWTETVNAGPTDINSSTCVVVLAATHPHSAPAYLTSGTAGLQEAINATGTQWPNSIILNSAWYALGGSTEIISTAKGNSEVALVDITTAPYTWYVWNASQYVAVTGPAVGVGSVFGRTGVVTAETGDYDCAEVTGCVPSPVASLNSLQGALSLTGDSSLSVTPNSGSGTIALHATGTGSLPLAGGTLYGELFAPDINGELYPAACGGSSPPSWCSGATADAWIRAACTQLPSTGGVINLLGLTGTLAASVTCSTPTKQVIMLEDPTSVLTVTESDGGTVFPLDEASMFLGPGAGQCLDGGGIHLAASANITAIVAPANTDGSQETITATGLCLYGTPGATVTQGLMYAKQIYANSIFENNAVSVCNTACIKLLDVGEFDLRNNWLNVEDGVPSINGSPLIIQGAGLGNGCNVGPVDVSGGQIEHAVGGGPEILVEGDGSGLVLACSIHIHDLGIERTPAGTASTNGIDISDCKNCSVENITASGVSSTSQAMIKLTQNFANSIQNAVIRNISNIFGTYTNTLNDTTTNGIVLPFASQDFITTYYSNPGYVQPPVLPGTTIQSLGSDFMNGLGNFSTGDANFGTDFAATGCESGQGLSCTFTRTNSTAPSGYTYSQEVQITANTDSSIGFNGIEYTPSISFTAGQTYVASFYAKGDGTFTGLPTFLLWDSVAPIFYCQATNNSPFTTTWTLYTFLCTPHSSGSGTNLLAIAAETATGATGTFWFAGFSFAPVQPLTPGNLMSSVSPYGIGPATAAQQTVTINSTACQLAGSCTVPAGPAASITQTVSNATGGTCSMSAGTTCTLTIGFTYTTPVCIATQQSGTLTGGAAGCTVSGNTVTITSATSNSETWGALVFGNPN